MKSIEILFKDDNSIWSPLSHLYLSNSSKLLLSRHPINVVEEVVSIFCTQCLVRFSEDEVHSNNHRCPQCFLCSNCEFGIMIKLKAEDYLCSSCESFSLQKENVRKYNQTVEGKSLRGYFNHLAATFQEDTNRNHKSNRDTISFNKPLEIGSFGDNHPYFDGSLLKSSSLKSKRVLRCKADLLSGKMNILVQPKLLPLEGDSSLRSQRGKWCIKDSSAIHYLPTISFISAKFKHAEESEGQEYIELKFANSAQYDVQIRFVTDDPKQLEQSLVTIDTNTGDFVQHHDFFSEYSLISTAAHNNLSVRLQAYEDELLRDITDSNDTQSTADEARQDEYSTNRWNVQIKANTAVVKIPIIEAPVSQYLCLKLQYELESLENTSSWNKSIECLILLHKE